MRSGEVEIVGHVRQQASDVEADGGPALAADRKFFALNGDDFMCRAMLLMHRRVNAGGWDSVSRLVGVTLAIFGGPHAKSK